MPALERTAVLSGLGDWVSRGSGPLYLRLAAALRAAFQRGDLPAGSTLPPERSLAVALAVSRGTVMAAYDVLRREGLLASRQGSGTWVRPDVARPLAVVDDVPAAALRTRRLTGRLVERRSGVIDLALAAPADPMHLPRQLLAVPGLDELHRWCDGHGYQPLGLPMLREEIARHLTHRAVPTTGDQVAVTAGGQQALWLVTELLVRPGDTVVVESPTFPGILDVLTRAGARVVSVPPLAQQAGTAVLAATVRAHAARLVYLVPDAQNPTGRTLPPAHRAAIARLVDEHPVYLVEDMTLSELVFSPRRHVPVGAHVRRGRVLTVGSLSKVAWGGLRVGWVRGEAALVDRLGRLKASHDLGQSPLPQAVAVRVLEQLDAVSAAARSLFLHRRDLAMNELDRLLPEWEWEQPAGGLCLWARLPEGDADSFVQLALRHGVDVSPGSAHAVDDAVCDHVRISYGQSEAVLREGLGRLAAAWTRYRRGPQRRATG